MNTVRKTQVTVCLLAAVAGSVLATGPAVPFAQAAPAKKTVKKVQPQKVTITLPAGYTSGAATLKAGKPAEITFYLKSDAGCGNSIKFPAAHWSKTLNVGERATVKYTPKKSGSLYFACSMDMDKGTIIVK